MPRNNTCTEMPEADATPKQSASHVQPVLPPPSTCYLVLECVNSARLFLRSLLLCSMATLLCVTCVSPVCSPCTTLSGQICRTPSADVMQPGVVVVIVVALRVSGVYPYPCPATICHCTVRGLRGQRGSKGTGAEGQ